MYLANRNPKINFCLHLILILITSCIPSILTGCTSPNPKKIDLPSLSDKEFNPQKIRSWTWSGKFFIKDRDFSQSGTLVWRKSESKNHLQIKGPMRVGIADFIIEKGAITYSRIIKPSNSHRITNFLRNEVPFEKINHWLLGIEEDRLETQNSYSNSANFIQHGEWQITYKNWKKYNENMLPSEIIIKTNSMNIRLITLSWVPTK